VKYIKLFENYLQDEVVTELGRKSGNIQNINVYYKAVKIIDENIKNGMDVYKRFW